MGMGFASTWLRQMNPPLHKTTLTTDSGATVASLSAEVSQLRRDLTIQALVDKRCQLERDSLTDG